MIMMIDHEREDQPLRKVLNLLLNELNSLCRRHQPEAETTQQNGGDEIGGAAAFRLRKLTDLAEWLERQMEEYPLDTKAIGQRQIELSSFLTGCGRRDLLPTLLRTLGAPEHDSMQASHAPILSAIEQCSWGASDVLRLSSSQPHILHYLILQARNHDAAQEAWQQLKKHEEYLSADILVHIILNSGIREVVQDAWVLVRGREDLSRRHFESLARSAPFPQIREQAQSLIER